MNDHALAVAPDRESSQPTAVAQALVATAQQEVQAQVVMARKFPRDQGAALKRIESACANTRLAETAEYAYRRGGQEVTGPSIRLLEAIKQSWGNIRAGIKVTHRGATESHAVAFAWDLETNDYHEIAFVVNHWRDTKKGGYAVTDERDIYELVANYGSRRLRKCLETVIPRHVVDAAREAVARTMNGLGDLEQRRAKCVEAFKKFGVTVDQLEKRLGKKVSAASNADLASLQRIYTSIADGASKVEEWFESLEPQKIQDLSKPVVDDTEAKKTFDAQSQRVMKMGANPLDILRNAIPNPSLKSTDVDKAKGATIVAYADLLKAWADKEENP